MEELLAKAHLARAFQDPLVEEFFDRTEERLFDNWRTSGAKDKENREEIYLQCLGIQAFRKFIEEVIILGKMAEAELKEKEGASNP